MLTAHDTERLSGLHPTLVAAITDVFAAMATAGTPMFVVQGLRTTAQQQALYAKGRTAPGAIVTDRDGVTKKSNHQAKNDGFGHACDCAFLPTAAQRDPFAPSWPWHAFGDALEARGITWGGRFTHPIDLDHAELP